ncbi:hypothetical protein [Patulibacter sp. SYSU D01012]|uniref:hypothetical protein n=1 Tax=Patulibacter sp. SYSU D01012 TaxID=2817381 RepID=UPI001B308C39|nr:hypothetical protein [Patulibacter sp. SYSU D01012]
MSTQAPELPVPQRPVAPILDAAAPRPVGQGSRRRPDDVPAPVHVGGVETALVFLLSWLVFAAIGYRVVITQHVVPGDALDLMSRAFYVWHNDPAKLAAIGFTDPPLQTIGLLPFAIVKPLASSLVALPVASGFWGAAALTMLHRTMARCGLGLPIRVVGVLLIGLNPLWLFYATTGMPDMIYVWALAATAYFLMTWAIEDQARFIAGVGLFLALLAMSRFGFLAMAIVLAAVLAWVLAARNADEDEQRGLLTTLLSPVGAILVVWVMACWIIASNPFGWLLDARPFGGTSRSNGAQHVELAPFLEHLGVLTAGVAITAALGLLGLVARAKNRDNVAAGILVLALTGIALVAGNALVHDDMSLLTLRAMLPVGVIGTVAVIWLARVDGATGRIMGLIALAIAFPAAALAMDRYPYQNLEQAFLRALVQQTDQEGTSSRGGYPVGIRAEQRMAAFVKVMAGRRPDAVLADNSTTGGVILLTGRPEVFLDRVDHGDAAFLRTLQNPWGAVQYLLVTRRQEDSVATTYPGVAQGRRPGLRPVFSYGGYTLVSVARTDPTKTRRTPAAPGGAAAGPGTTGGAAAAGSTGGTTTSTTAPGGSR